jgi:hypothetical protein
MVPGMQYIANNAVSRINFTLPATCPVGLTLAIIGYGAGQWRISQNAGQLIHGGSDTTTGTGGYLQSQTRTDSVFLRCVVADTEFLITNKQGTLTSV